MKDLLTEGHEFAFFQAVRLLQQQSAGPPLGRDGPVAQERIRLRPDTSLSFAPADVIAIDEIAAAQGTPERYRLTTRFLGLYGASSPLPTHYAETILHGEPLQSRVRDFLDQFHHRLLSLFYRSWARYHYIALYSPDGKDDLSRRLLAALAFADQLGAKLGQDSVGLLAYMGLFSRRVRSRRCLEVLWSELLGAIPIELSPHQGRWVAIPFDQRARLGLGACSCATDFVIGTQVFDTSGKFRVSIGPLDYDHFERFLPGGDGQARLGALVEATLPTAFAYEVELKLERETCPPVCLGTDQASRLGWTTWLPATERIAGSPEAHEVVFQSRM